MCEKENKARQLLWRYRDNIGVRTWPLLLGPDAILNIKLLTEGRLLGLFEDTTNEAMPINPRVPSTCWQPAAMTVLFVERRGLQWTAVISVDTTNIMRPNTNQRLISEPRVFVEISISLIWFDIDLSQKDKHLVES
ncbi:hypothetical protein NC652_006366 [Populus alba x Populus x berolinensis]|nr:hypothetical protein NC652_006366 [Populus alba x Populus x berolinensis]